MGITAAFMVPHPPLIVPEVGRGQEKGIQKTIDSYKEAAKRVSRQRPETIVLFSPHQIMYADYFHISPGNSARGDFGQFRAAQQGMKIKDFHIPLARDGTLRMPQSMEVTYDAQFVKELCMLAASRDLPAGTLGEKDSQLDHGTLVPLYFINQYYTDYKLVRIGLSGLPLLAHYELGKCIMEVSEKLHRKTVIIASGDLSHRLKEDGPYGYKKEGPEYDFRIMEVMGKADFKELLKFPEDLLSSAGECGHRSFTIMAGALDKKAVMPERLSYEGPFGVGYGICAYEITGVDENRNFGEQFKKEQSEKMAKMREKEDDYVKLARNAVEEYVNTGKKLKVLEGLPDEMYEERAGVFVSIHKDGGLRGCIGTTQGVRNSIAEEIIENAISASTKDPRFSPILPEELDSLEINVDVLGKPEKIDSRDKLDVKRYGVIVSRGYRRGLLLPDLDGVDTVEEQIAIAKRKAGIDDDEEVELERFEVVRHF